MVPIPADWMPSPYVLLYVTSQDLLGVMELIIGEESALVVASNRIRKALLPCVERPIESTICSEILADVALRRAKRSQKEIVTSDDAAISSACDKGLSLDSANAVPE